MPANLTGRDLDLAVHARVFGTQFQCPGNWLPRYHDSWDAMRPVVEEMKRRGWWCRMQSPFDPSIEAASKYTAGFCPLSTTGWNGQMDHSAQSDSLPTAVCLAALKALESENAD